MLLINFAEIFKDMDELAKNIIKTAEEKFIQLGIRNVSVDDICNEVHISKKTFYKYFPQKEDLIIAIIEDFRELSDEKFNRIYQNRNAIDALVQIIKEIKKDENKRPHVFMHDLKKYYPEIYNRFKEEQHSKIKGDFELNLRKGISEGYYREDLDVEMVSLFHSIQIKNVYEEMQAAEPKIKEKRFTDFFIDLIVRMITNEKGYEYIKNKLSKDNN